MTTVTEINTTQMYQVFIKATPEQILEAITNQSSRRSTSHGTVINSTFEVGAPYLGLSGD